MNSQTNTHWMFPNCRHIRKPAETMGRKTSRNESELNSILQLSPFLLGARQFEPDAALTA